MSTKIPAGTRMYLTKKYKPVFNIQPDTTFINDSLYVLYDVRVNGQTIIPRGTRVLGDWVTESTPTIAAQFQAKKIFLCCPEQSINADSDVLEATTLYNGFEVQNALNLYRTLEYRSTANIIRRIVNVQCKMKILLDDRLNSIYLEIPTDEIPVTFTTDFLPSCLPLPNSIERNRFVGNPNSFVYNPRRA
jgi:hypothetical protein